MKKINTLIVLTCLGLLLQTSSDCFAQDSPGTPGRKISTSLQISNVSLSRKTFNPAKGEQVKIKYRLSRNASAGVGIYDSMNRLVRVIHGSDAGEPGYSLLLWDGKDQRGTIVPDDAYTYVIYAMDKEGNISMFDPVDSGGLKLDLRHPSLNRRTGEIEYVLPKAGRVRIRLGIEDGPLLLTLIDWEPRQAGRQKEIWDGRDEPGLMINPLANPDISVVLSAFSLPDNSVITTGNNLTREGYKEVMPAEEDFNLSTGHIVAYKKNTSSRRNKAVHAPHPREDCHEPGFRIELVGHTQNEGGIPLINGMVPVRIHIDKKDKQRLIDSRFEVMFYVDHVFLFEEEEGFSPFTYMWDTNGMSEGEHLLTLNILGYDNHIGTKTVKIKIKRR